MSSQDISYKTGELAGQAQVKKDQLVDRASEACQSASQSLQQNKGQAGGFLHQTGEKVANMAQGAADAVKNTLGMGNNDDNNSRGNNPSSRT